MTPRDARDAVVEECAKVCDKLAREWERADAQTSYYAATDCAAAIRALKSSAMASPVEEKDNGT